MRFLSATACACLAAVLCPAQAPMTPPLSAAMTRDLDTRVAKVVPRVGRPGPAVALRAGRDAPPVIQRTGFLFASEQTEHYNNRTVGVMQ